MLTVDVLRHRLSHRGCRVRTESDCEALRESGQDAGRACHTRRACIELRGRGPSERERDLCAHIGGTGEEVVARGVDVDRQHRIIVGDVVLQQPVAPPVEEDEPMGANGKAECLARCSEVRRVQPRCRGPAVACNRIRTLAFAQ